MFSPIRVICLVAFLVAGSAMAQEQDLSQYSLSALINARWKLVTDSTCAKSNIKQNPGNLVDHVPPELSPIKALDPGDTLQKLLNQNGTVMSQAESDAGWCRGQAVVAAKLDAAIKAKLNADSHAEIRAFTSRFSKIVAQAEGMIRKGTIGTPSAGGAQ